MLSTGTMLSMEEFDAEIERADILCAEDIQRLCTLRLAFPPAEKLRILDPFSAEYRQAVLDVYAGY
jgi:hypothetical protein